MSNRCVLFACLILAPQVGWALETADIPAEAPNDALTATPAEVRQMHNWALAAFSIKEPAAERSPVTIVVRRQDHNVLRFGQSCMETPMKIGQQEFKHGLGTHANSDLLVTIPPGSKTFKAMVGIDNNYDTQGIRGSVQFSVEIGGKEVFRTATLKGGNAPVPVSVELPKDTREIVLKVDTTADGPAHDQADWADAQIITDDGRTVWIDQQPSQFLVAGLPFSFQYGGAASGEALKGWKHAAETKEDKDATRHTVMWTDPKTGLCVRAVVTAWSRYPAVDWVLHFENQGKEDTPLLSDVQAIDVQLGTGPAKRAPILHHLTGDVCGERTFLPLETPLEPSKPITLAPVGGRPSNGAFPFFNLQYGNQGLITAIGWSGQWAASLARTGNGPTRLQAGMEKIHLRLRPGEQIRSPRILVMAWQGDRQAAHNRWRRLLLFHYVPQLDGRPLRLPVASQCFDRYSATRPAWATEAGQIEAAEFAHRIGCDTHWFDAAWFEGGFPNGVGNWYHKPKEFPHGLKPVSDACHARGLKFILWFEPERVAAGSQIAREHPEFVFGGDKGGLFKLNDPAALKWLTELLSRRISEFGLDVYRNDFNIDPLRFWRAADAPDRQGMTEIRYVEGHYALWDALIAKHPSLWIDNCASGGRRIDLETCMRSVPLWRSDTGCSPGHQDWNQTQTQGLSLYVPLFTSCGWNPDAYELRSSATGGAICQFAYLDEKFSADQAKAALEEIKQNQKYWYGDYYPLTRASLASDQWVAYQFHRSDLNAGLVLAFRRGECNYPALAVSLQGINPEGIYAVEFIDDARQKVCKTMSGRELSCEMELRLPKKGSSLVMRYSISPRSTANMN